MDERDLMRGALKATGIVKKGAQLKYGAIAMVIFVVGLVLLGMFFPAGQASAADCEDTGPGTADASAVSEGTGTQATGTLHEQQVEYAKDIDQAAKKAKLPGRATLIALMTAMQESTMQNLDHGHADSLGLFQQRPSMGWGTKQQIMTPSYAAESFFLGRSTNDGLTDIKGWNKIPLGDAAQKVQKSAHPELYAGHETAMRKLAKDAGINLERDGSTTGGSSTGDDTTPVTSENDNCGVTTPGTGGTGGSAGGKFTDGKQTWDLKNPRSVEEAIAWAKKNSGPGSTANWYQRCLAFTAIVYGWQFSGVNYAIDHYRVVPKSMQHDGDRHPRPGPSCSGTPVTGPATSPSTSATARSPRTTSCGPATSTSSTPNCSRPSGAPATSAGHRPSSLAPDSPAVATSNEPDPAGVNAPRPGRCPLPHSPSAPCASRAGGSKRNPAGRAGRWLVVMGERSLGVVRRGGVSGPPAGGRTACYRDFPHGSSLTNVRPIRSTWCRASPLPPDRTRPAPLYVTERVNPRGRCARCADSVHRRAA